MTEATKIKNRERVRLWRIANPEKRRLQWLRQYRSNPSEHKARAYRYVKSHQEQVAVYRRRWASENPDKVREKSMRFDAAHREQRREYARVNRKRAAARDRIRRLNDPQFALSIKIRSRVNVALHRAKRGARRSATLLNLVGCSWLELSRHLEEQFQTGMSWGNHGEWHIDHKRPCASFDLTQPEQQKQCFHYSNLQPLWAADNLRKGAKWALTS